MSEMKIENDIIEGMKAFYFGMEVTINKVTGNLVDCESEDSKFMVYASSLQF